MSGARADALKIVLFLAAAAMLRVPMLPLLTDDFDYFLIPWLRHAESVGGGYLSQSFTNYTAFYDHALALIAQIPGPEVLRIKLFSIMFDVVLAYAVSLVAPPGKKILAFGITLVVPTIAMNSAFMGQADAMYTSMIVFSLAAALRRRPVWSMLAFSAGIAIKLQAVMFLPVLVLLFLERRQPLWTFTLIPVAYIIFSLPMIIAGRPLDQVFLVYFGQFSELKLLSANAPNPWMILRSFVDYQTGIMVGLPIAAVSVCMTVLYLWRTHIIRSDEGLLVASAILLILAPYLAPKMHDRYFFMVDPILIALLFYNRYYIIPFILAELGSSISYVTFLSLKYYDHDHWLIGDKGFLQEQFGFGLGMFPAFGAITMGVSLFLLVKRAISLRSNTIMATTSAPDGARQFAQPD